MANHMEEIAAILGVALEEEFHCTDGFGFKYVLTDHGLLCDGAPAPDCLAMLLDGTMKIIK